MSLSNKPQSIRFNKSILWAFSSQIPLTQINSKTFSLFLQPYFCKILLAYSVGLIRSLFIREWSLKGISRSRRKKKLWKVPITIGHTNIETNYRQITIHISLFLDTRSFHKSNLIDSSYIIFSAQKKLTKVLGFKVYINFVNYFKLFIWPTLIKGRQTKHASIENLDYTRERRYFSKLRRLYRRVKNKLRRFWYNRYFPRVFNIFFSAFVNKRFDPAVIVNAIGFEISNLRKRHIPFIKFIFKISKIFFNKYKHKFNLSGIKIQFKGRMVPFNREHPRSLLKVLRLGCLNSTSLNKKTYKVETPTVSRFGSVFVTLSVSKKENVFKPHLQNLSFFFSKKIFKRKNRFSLIRPIGKKFNCSFKLLNSFFFFFLHNNLKSAVFTQYIAHKFRFLFAKSYWRRIKFVYKEKSNNVATENKKTSLFFTNWLKNTNLLFSNKVQKKKMSFFFSTIFNNFIPINIEASRNFNSYTQYEQIVNIKRSLFVLKHQINDTKLDSKYNDFKNIKAINFLFSMSKHGVGYFKLTRSTIIYTATCWFFSIFWFKPNFKKFNYCIAAKLKRSNNFYITSSNLISLNLSKVPILSKYISNNLLHSVNFLFFFKIISRSITSDVSYVLLIYFMCKFFNKIIRLFNNIGCDLVLFPRKINRLEIVNILELIRLLLKYGQQHTQEIGRQVAYNSQRKHKLKLTKAYKLKLKNVLNIKPLQNNIKLALTLSSDKLLVNTIRKKRNKYMFQKQSITKYSDVNLLR